MATAQHTAGARGTMSRSDGQVISAQTEARPALMTTEFWVSLIASVAVVAAGYLDDALDVDLAWILGAAITAAYILSRGIAKAGSGESFVGSPPMDMTR